MKSPFDSAKVANVIALLALAAAIFTYIDTKRKSQFDISVYNEERRDDLLSAYSALKAEIESTLVVSHRVKAIADQKVTLDIASNISGIIVDLQELLKSVAKDEKSLHAHDLSALEDPGFWYRKRREVREFEARTRSIRTSWEGLLVELLKREEKNA